MNRRLHHALPMALLLGMVAVLSTDPLVAQETDPLVAQEIGADAPEIVQPAAEQPDGRPANMSIREQNIYIPYDKLRQVFEKHGRGVFLPYEKFQELWQAAREETKPAADPKPPVGALITEIENEATVARDVVRVKALLKIEILAEGWNEIPLRLADAAITSATLDGQPARIIGSPSQNYKLLVEKKGKQPEQIELTLEYAKAITRMPGQNSVSFQSPQAPVSRWRVRIPESGVKVNIHPLIAATEEPAEVDGGTGEDEPAAETVVLAFVGAAPMVRIDWTPKAEGATGLKALVSVQAQQQVHLAEGVARTSTQLSYTISRAELAQLKIDVPIDQKVVNVFDANVRQWSVEDVAGDVADDVEDDANGARRQITAQLFEPAKGQQQVIVELERFAGDETQSTFVVPVVKALDVGRQQGVVVVRVAGGLRAETTQTGGLLQVDTSELPAPLNGSNWDFSYRYGSVPFELQLGIEKVEPRILVDSLVEAFLEPERLSVNMTAVYDVQRAGVFRLELDVPVEYEVREVVGQTVGQAKPVEVDTHHRDNQDKTRLIVNLTRKALGPVALLVRLHRDLDEQSDLLTHTGKAVDIPLPIPRVAADTVERETGRILVHAPESLRVNPTTPTGLRSVSFNEALSGMATTRAGKLSPLQPVLAFAYTQEPASLELSAERRKPQVTIKQLLVARIENGVVKYQVIFFYKVLYSGVESLRIDVPADVAADLRNETPGIQDKVIEPAPKDLAEGDVAWRFTGESELLGDGKIELVWEEKLEKLGIGKSIDLAVPQLKPRGVDRAWGQIVLAKAETIDIHEKDGRGEAETLRPIDPQRDLMAPVAGGARAFEFHENWSLSMTVTQYELEEIKHTSIERAVVRTVVTPAGELSVQALYRMRSARQRLELELPADVGFDTEPLRINGRPVTLEHGEKGEYFIPLLESPGTLSLAEKPFLLELRYTIPAGKHAVASRLELPNFQQEPAAGKVYLCVYLPHEDALLGSTGPWSEEFNWRLDPKLNWMPVPRAGESSLISWVTEGISQTSNPLDSFQTDGRLYVFSTLRPAPPPAGALRMRTVDQTWLGAIVFAIVILGGVLLLPFGTSARATAVGLLIVALVLCGVFLPTFALQVLDGVLASALFVVFVLWIVWFFVKTWPTLQWEKRPVVSEPATQPDAVAVETPEEPAVNQRQPEADTDEGGAHDE